MRSIPILGGTVLAVLLSLTASSFAVGRIVDTDFGKVKDAEEVSFTTNCTCQNNGAQDWIKVDITITNQNGTTVGGAHASGTGNSLGAGAVIPAALVHSGDKFTATVTLTQQDLEGDTTNSKVTAA